MTRHLDPDRLRPAPPHPGFAPLPPDVALDVCRQCRVAVPATDLARARHQEHDARFVMVATIALSSQLSGSVAVPPPGAAGPDPNVGAGETEAGETGPDPQIARPGIKRPPGPTAQEVTADRAGAGGPNQSKPDAGVSLPDVNQPPDATPQAPGGAQRAGGDSGGTEDVPSGVPAGTDPEAADLALFERDQAASDRRWLR